MYEGVYLKHGQCHLCAMLPKSKKEIQQGYCSHIQSRFKSGISKSVFCSTATMVSIITMVEHPEEQKAVLKERNYFKWYNKTLPLIYQGNLPKYFTHFFSKHSCHANAPPCIFPTYDFKQAAQFGK